MKPITSAEIAALARFVANAQLSYHEENKEHFLRETRRLAARFATELALNPSQFDLRVNRGGIAGSGDVMLHADHLYVSLNAEIDFGRGRAFMFRGCQSRQDYTGLGNRWALWHDIGRDFSGVVSAMRVAMNEATTVNCPPVG